MANQFDDAVYDRGALTLQALRKTVGDDTFFKILQTWQVRKVGRSGIIPEFIALAEQISGKPLDALFHMWLYTTGKPPVGPNDVAADSVARPPSYDQIEQTHQFLAAQHAY